VLDPANWLAGNQFDSLSCEAMLADQNLVQPLQPLDNYSLLCKNQMGREEKEKKMKGKDIYK
jgi:hypothetical protein